MPLSTYFSLNATLTQSKNFPFGINITIELKNITTASENNET